MKRTICMIEYIATVFPKKQQMKKNVLFPLIILVVLSVSLPVSPIDVPGTYLCKAVRLTQKKNGRTYSKGFQVQELYLVFTPREVRAFGTHSKFNVCRKLDIRYYTPDTVYLTNPEATFGHSELKLFMIGDTIMGNVNLFDTDTSNISIKVIVEKIQRVPIPELERLCQ